MTDEAFDFQPWNTYKDASKLDLPIDAPPCVHCRFWRPRIRTTEWGEPDGVVLCSNPKDMYHDFSCFKPKDKAQP